MAVAVQMPKKGITVESCIITKWLKAVGDPVKAEDMLFCYETDKASFEEAAGTEGTLLAILFQEMDDVPVFANVAVIGAPGEDISSFAPQGAGVAAPIEDSPPAAAPAAVPAAEAPRVQPGAPGSEAVSPRARSVAARLGVDAAQAQGTGPQGRVIERDVRALFQSGVAVTPQAAQAQEQAAPAAAQKGGYREERLSTVRRAIARNMVASLQSMAQLTLSSSFDATAILAQRQVFKASKDAEIAGITLTDMVNFATARALARPEHAHFNAHLLEDTMRYFSDVHLAFAVDTPRGLLVPTIMGAQDMSLRQLSAAAKELASKAQSGDISPDLLGGATFTISNLGGLGIEHFTPVINPPQTGILGINNIQYRPRASGEGVYPAMGLSITFDHKALDGADAARFLRAVGASLERFSELLAG